MVFGFTRNGVAMIRTQNDIEVTLKDYAIWNSPDEDWKIECTGACQNCKWQLCDNHPMQGQRFAALRTKYQELDTALTLVNIIGEEGEKDHILEEMDRIITKMKKVECDNRCSSCPISIWCYEE